MNYSNNAFYENLYLLKDNFSLPVLLAVFLLTFLPAPIRAYESRPPTFEPLETLVDLHVGESAEIALTDGTLVELTLLEISDERDTTPQNAVRRASATVVVNGERVTIDSGNYHLPVEAGGIQIDIPVIAVYYYVSGSDDSNPAGGRFDSKTTGGSDDHNKTLYDIRKMDDGSSDRDRWKLEKDARLRLWPADSPLIEPGTFVYPVRQRFFSSETQGTNVPTFVDGGDRPDRSSVYYHEGFDIGGYEGKTDIVAATDGVIVSIGDQQLDAEKHPPVRPRYDVLYILDDRGWYYRYSHLKSFETRLQLGERVTMGEKLGDIGKEGGSGGWAHLHFDIHMPVPSGEFGLVCPYAYLWETYLRDYNPNVIAVARPHHLVYTGESVELDGTRSWVPDGHMDYEWRLTDGTTVASPKFRTSYHEPGSYSEILKVTDGQGNLDYDFAAVQVLDPDDEELIPPTLHAAYHPTFNIRAGDPVYFAVRAFRLDPSEGQEAWDFGDGSPVVITHSQPGDRHKPDGYAETVHRFTEPGNYIVTVQRTSNQGLKATARLFVEVGPDQLP